MRQAPARVFRGSTTLVWIVYETLLCLLMLAGMVVLVRAGLMLPIMSAPARIVRAAPSPCRSSRRT